MTHLGNGEVEPELTGGPSSTQRRWFGIFALIGVALAVVLYRPLLIGVTEPIESVRRPMR